MLLVVGVLVIVAGVKGAGGKVERQSKEIAHLPALDAIANQPVKVPPGFRPSDPIGVVVTDVEQRNADAAIRSSLTANNWKGSVTYQLRLATLASNDLRTFPTERNAIAIVIVNLFPTEQASTRFQSDSVTDLVSLGNAKLGPIPGIPGSTVLQGSHPIDDRDRPGSVLVTTYFHAAIGPSTLQASFTCINCPLGQLASDQTDLFVPFVNALTPLLPPPGSSMVEHTRANVALICLGALLSLGGVSLTMLPAVRRRSGRLEDPSASAKRR